MSNEAFWVEMIQNDIFRAVLDYQMNNSLNKDELSKAIGCTPRMTTQLLNGNANCSIKKLADIMTRMGMCPEIKFISLDEAVKKRETHALDQRNDRP